MIWCLFTPLPEHKNIQTHTQQVVTREDDASSAGEQAGSAPHSQAGTPTHQERVPSPSASQQHSSQQHSSLSQRVASTLSEASSASIIEEEGVEELDGDGSLNGDADMLFTPPSKTSHPTSHPHATSTSAAPQHGTAGAHTPSSGTAADVHAGSPGGTSSQRTHSQGSADPFALSESALSEGLGPVEQPLHTHREGSEGRVAFDVQAGDGEERVGALVKEKSEIAAPTGSVGSSSSAEGRSSNETSGKISDYSMSFDGIEDEEFEVDAATSSRAHSSVTATAATKQPEPSSTEIAEQITRDTMRRVFSDSGEVCVCVCVGTQCLRSSYDLCG